MPGYLVVHIVRQRKLLAGWVGGPRREKETSVVCLLPGLAWPDRAFLVVAGCKQAGR